MTEVLKTKEPPKVVLPAPVSETKRALQILERQYPEKAAFFVMLTVELQALLDGAITFAGKDGKEHAVTEAQACAAIMHAARNGQSVAAGHIIYIGDKLYTTPAGYLAAAENRGDFLGFSPVRAMTPEEKEFMGLTIGGKDPHDGKTVGQGKGERPMPPRYSCMVAVAARRRGYEHESVGFGWWDVTKDRENQMSIPAQAAISRARRRCLMGLYSLGTPLGADSGDHGEDVIDATLAEERNPAPALPVADPVLTDPAPFEWDPLPDSPQESDDSPQEDA